MARKFLQMGYTRARRYTNYKGGKKYNKAKNYALNEKGTGDPDKAFSADIFYQSWQAAKSHPEYIQLRKAWIKKYG